MGVFDKAHERFRDKTRDNICASLQMLGINAQMAERGRREEYAAGSSPMGIIDIAEGLIRWVNVGRGRGTALGEENYFLDFGVPDHRLGLSSPRVRIKSNRKKAFPLFGRIVDLRWKGDDSDLGIISRLNSDISVKDPITKSRGVTICAIRDYSCWIISTEWVGNLTREQWNCYQAIARHLVAEWSSS